MTERAAPPPAKPKPRSEASRLFETAKSVAYDRETTLRLLVGTGMYTAKGQLKRQFK